MIVIHPTKLETTSTTLYLHLMTNVWTIFLLYQVFLWQ